MSTYKVRTIRVVPEAVAAPAPTLDSAKSMHGGAPFGGPLLEGSPAVSLQPPASLATISQASQDSTSTTAAGPAAPGLPRSPADAPTPRAGSGLLPRRGSGPSAALLSRTAPGAPGGALPRAGSDAPGGGLARAASATAPPRPATSDPMPRTGSGGSEAGPTRTVLLGGSPRVGERVSSGLPPVPARRPLQSVRSAPEGSKALGGRGGGPDAMPTLGLEKSVRIYTAIYPKPNPSLEKAVRPASRLGGTLLPPRQVERPPLPAPARVWLRGARPDRTAVPAALARGACPDRKPGAPQASIPEGIPLMPPENGDIGAAGPGGRPPRGPEPAPPADGGSPGAECSSVTAEMRETWMLLEYCDRGNLDRAILNRVFVRDGKANLARRPSARPVWLPVAIRLRGVRRALGCPMSPRGGASRPAACAWPPRCPAAPSGARGASTSRAPPPACGGRRGRADRVRAARLQDAVLRSLIDIAAGMDYLHSLGVLHGDLKGPNVLLKTSVEHDPRGFCCKARRPRRARRRTASHRRRRSRLSA